MKKPGTIFPIFNLLATYPKEWCRADIIAGLTTSAVVIPKSMAYAAIAGLPLVVGLYTALIPLVVYAVLGTSRTLSVTTTSTIAILVAGVISQVAPNADPGTQMQVAATLALLVGVFLLLAGVLRFGVIANFISEPVLIGFKAGIGLVIVLDQVPKLLGIHIAKAGFFQDIWSIAMHLPEAFTPTVILAVAMLAFMLLLERFAPRVPAPLATVAAGMAASMFLGLDRMGIQLVGQMQAGLPSFAIPDVSLIGQLWPNAMGIALMSFVETAAAGRAFMLPGDLRPRTNQELIALGAANLAGSLFHMMPAGGGTSQTAVNRGAGARSQVSSLVAAAGVIATLLFLAPLFGLMPQATLAVVVVVTSIGLISPVDFMAVRRIRTREFRWAVIGMAGVVLLGTLKGILVAVLASLCSLIIMANIRLVLVLGRKPGTQVFRPLLPEHPEDETFPGLLLVRPQGTIYFANAERIGDFVWPIVHKQNPKVVAFDCSAIIDIEYTALKMLIEAEEKLRLSGIELWMVALNPEPLHMVQQTPLGETLGRERMFFTLEQAVAAYQERFGELAKARAG